MKKRLIINLILAVLCTSFSSLSQTFSMKEVAMFPFPSELTSSPTENQIAWAMNEQGKRNVFLASGPDYVPEQITSFNSDDGQEISSFQFSPDGKFLLFVRGGDHGGGNAERPVNPLHKPIPPEVGIWKINLEDKKTEYIGEGDRPTIGKPHQVAFLRNGDVWTADLASENTPEKTMAIKGDVHSLTYSPDGSSLAFVADREDHSFIGIYEDSNIRWINPGFHHDRSPRWSTDGRKIAFVRTSGGEGAELPLLEQRHRPWEIWITDLENGESLKRWKAPETLRGSIPTVHGGFNLNWAAEDRLVFLSYEDGWPHLYSMDAELGEPMLLTPGPYHVEHVNMSPDRKSLVFSANAGPMPEDIDRRHIGIVPVAGGDVTWKTTGTGIEAYPVFTGDQDALAFLSATAKRPLLPTILKEGNMRVLAKESIPQDFPQEELVEPQHVTFRAPDGTLVYGQLFQTDTGPAEKPGVVFVHGGPQRQMLLGWSYMDYYSNTYAINQFLANAGFVVLSVNYRLGIGYGHDFHKPDNTYYKGAAEYQDIKAAGEYLAGLPEVDAERIGIYGGSYGGYLTALALGKDSDLFKVGVDIHGVHDFENRYDLPEGYEVAPDYEEAKKIAWESSPLAYLDSWKSPVLLIHGDDDRNVHVSHTTNLVRRLEEKEIPHDFMMIPNETHHWMKFSNMVKVDQAITDFLIRNLKE
ncbi:S9 family peptidase [Salinimicrobium terrae]|uniref:S9 family peptidase n=1 Tax=Salinimicrobium terrae TaxID=470866 RepID=UPI00041BAD2C|nr:prolyl oligopeptidase family serine peptidase [Salinimicrobium terrae]